MNTKLTADSLRKMSRLALYDLAKKLKIQGCTKFDKNQLITAIIQFAEKALTPVKSTRVSGKQTTTPVSAKPAASFATKMNAKKISQPELPLLPGEKASASPVSTKKTAKPKLAVASDKNADGKEKRVKPAKKAAPEIAETPAKKRGRPAKVAESEVIEAPAKKRGRPTKAAELEVVEAPAKKRGRPAKVAESEVIEAPAKKRGRPAKVAESEVIEAPAKKRGRPVKSSPAQVRSPEFPVHALETNDLADPDHKTGAEKRLDRGFGKKAEDAPAPRNKKGAEVVQPSVAIPIEFSSSSVDAKPSRKAEQIEKERSRRHASLKTTMEIPIFSTPDPDSSAPVSEDELTGDLPMEYGETRIVIQIRDPHWAYVYWELPQIELKRLELEVGIFEFAHSHFVLRLHDVSHGYSTEIKLSEHARNWHVYLENPLTVYQVELGMSSPSEGYTCVALSNLVQTPPDQVSLRWAGPVLPDPEPDTDDRIAGHEIAPPPQSPKVASAELARLNDPDYVYFQSLTGEPLLHPGSSDLLAGHNFSQTGMPSSQEQQLLSPLDLPGSWQMPSSAMPTSLNPTSPTPTSPTPTSGEWPSSDSVSSLGRAAGEPEKVFLGVAADVIFYGSVARGCQLSFLGQPVKVRADGSYSLRLALPFDQEQKIELVAIDPVTGQSRVIKAKITLNND